MRQLVPSAVTPASLYVERDADRKLANLIADMGRPGYVLVARQMGKTNLLLNAKRKLEGPADLFIYLDLSSGYSDISSCFRTIIDTALNGYPKLFSAVGHKIRQIRLEN